MTLILSGKRISGISEVDDLSCDAARRNRESSRASGRCGCLFSCLFSLLSLMCLHCLHFPMPLGQSQAWNRARLESFGGETGKQRDEPKSALVEGDQLHLRASPQSLIGLYILQQRHIFLRHWQDSTSLSSLLVVLFDFLSSLN